MEHCSWATSALAGTTTTIDNTNNTLSSDALILLHNGNNSLTGFAPAFTNLINTNKPKERPSSLANGIRQCDAWKRRDGSCWPFGSVAFCN